MIAVAAADDVVGGRNVRAEPRVFRFECALRAEDFQSVREEARKSFDKPHVSLGECPPTAVHVQRRERFSPDAFIGMQIASANE